MKILHCLGCQQPSLVPTGAFWACASCGYAITGVALAIEQQVASRREAAARTTAARTDSEERPSSMWRRQKNQLRLRSDDWTVLISLLASLGMVILTVIACWLWKTLPETVEAMLFLHAIELP